MRAHYRACFEKGSAPLLRRPNPPLRTRWRGHPDGSQPLVADIDEGAGPLLLRGAGPWYVQPTARTFGRVGGSVPPLDSIAHAPAVPPGRIDALRRQLRTHKTPLPIPLPDTRAPTRRLTHDGQVLEIARNLHADPLHRVHAPTGKRPGRGMPAPWSHR